MNQELTFRKNLRIVPTLQPASLAPASLALPGLRVCVAFCVERNGVLRRKKSSVLSYLTQSSKFYKDCNKSLCFAIALCYFCCRKLYWKHLAAVQLARQGEKGNPLRLFCYDAIRTGLTSRFKAVCLVKAACGKGNTRSIFYKGHREI